MAKSKKFKVSKISEPESVIVDELIYSEIEEKEEGIDFKLAQQLTGHPIVFNPEFLPKLKMLVKENIAADFGEQGYARGHMWRTKVLKRSQ